MNEITQSKKYLPETVPELAKFVLIGREKLNSVRAEIRAIQKVGLAKEVLEQKKAEAQELAEAVLDAEVRTGELLKEIPKASGGDRRSENFKIDNGVDYEKPKSEVLKEANIPQKQAERYQFLAEHKEEVETAKKIARNNDSIVTRKMVTDLVAPKKDWQKEAVNRAKEQHEEFKQAKAETKVVSFADVQRDSRNLSLLAGEFELDLLKAIERIQSIKTYRDLEEADVSELCKALSVESRQGLVNKLLGAISTEKYLIQELRRGNG